MKHLMNTLGAFSPRHHCGSLKIMAAHLIIADKSGSSIPSPGASIIAAPGAETTISYTITGKK
jgi:hypothetical protein